MKERNLLKFLFLNLLVILFFFSAQQVSAKVPDKPICTTYFTYIGCHNCAKTDAVVLRDWIEKYPNLVVIEYMWEAGEWENPNSKLLGQYVKKYKSQSAVPQLFFSQGDIKLGSIAVPRAEQDIQNMESNPCLLLEGSISFKNLDLSQLRAYPKIWTNQRILIRTQEKDIWTFQWNGKGVSSKMAGEAVVNNELLKELLLADNTDKISEKLRGIGFEVIEPQKAKFSGFAFPSRDFVPYIEFDHAIKLKFSRVSSQPVQLSPEEIELSSQDVLGEEVTIPLIGQIKSENFSLPVLTFLIGLADGFNPCAFFILTFLLSALLGLAGSRKKIFIVGGIFVFFSALLYFLFMGAWLNVFLLGKEIKVLTGIAGAIAVLTGVVNIKDYFAFQKGISLTLPKSQKLKFIQRVRELSKRKTLWGLIIGSAVIAGTVNLYELLCTFGFPVVYTNVLTSRNLSCLQYYGYLVFYNLIYIIPLAVIILVFGFTLGKKKFGKLWVRRLKLVSGFMIFALGIVLIFNPKLLERIGVAFGLLFSAVIVSVLVVLINLFYQKKKVNK